MWGECKYVMNDPDAHWRNQEKHSFLAFFFSWDRMDAVMAQFYFCRSASSSRAPSWRRACPTPSRRPGVWTHIFRKRQRLAVLHGKERSKHAQELSSKTQRWWEDYCLQLNAIMNSTSSLCNIDSLHTWAYAVQRHRCSQWNTVGLITVHNFNRFCMISQSS